MELFSHNYTFEQIHDSREIHLKNREFRVFFGHGITSLKTAICAIFARLKCGTRIDCCNTN